MSKLYYEAMKKLPGYLVDKKTTEQDFNRKELIVNVRQILIDEILFIRKPDTKEGKRNCKILKKIFKLLDKVR